MSDIGALVYVVEDDVSAREGLASLIRPANNFSAPAQGRARDRSHERRPEGWFQQIFPPLPPNLQHLGDSGGKAWRGGIAGRILRAI
jgi:hypothetical protein